MLSRPPGYRRRNPLTVVVKLTAVFFLVTAVSLTTSRFSRTTSSSDGEHGYHVKQGRHKRSTDPQPLNCTPRSDEQFPGRFMSEETRRRGGIVVHVLIALYCFASVAVVCDEYFVAALEKIVEALDIEPDVAGATFMAAGSSAPEFFTAVIGVFIAKSDVGVASVVGSAVFNVLAVPAVCALLAGMVIELSWYPLIRDCVCYLISVIALMLVMLDEIIHWYEALSMFTMYILYIIVMRFNKKIEALVLRLCDKCKKRRRQGERARLVTENSRRYPNEIVAESHFTSDVEEDGKTNPNSGSGTDVIKPNEINGVLTVSAATEKDEKAEEFWHIPDTWPKRVLWVLLLPVLVLFFLTIPDCRRPGCWQRVFPLTFICSIIWIAGLTYVIIWMVVVFGDTLDIPDTVMGLTLIAAGSSTPDMLASIMVARDGKGNMAISNSIGSNVFDILLCLGFPWLLQTTFVAPDTIVRIQSSGLEFTVVTLFASVVFMLAVVAISKWKLNKKTGVLFLIGYAISITLACLYELNVFGYFNPPPCPP